MKRAGEDERGEADRGKTTEHDELHSDSPISCEKLAALQRGCRNGLKTMATCGVDYGDAEQS
jgi:hypothetical protein